MNRKVLAHLALSIIVLLKINFSFGQIAKGGIPLSISQKWVYDKPAFEVPKPDWARVREEDKKFGGSPRFALPISVDLTTENSGEWKVMNDGRRVWRLKIASTDAQGIALAFDNFELPKGARMYMLTSDGKERLGAYDASNNNESRQFFIGILRGSEAILEYMELKDTPKSKPFHINTVYHAYQMDGLAVSDFGNSQPCNVNINCTQGAAYQNEKRGVVRILVNTQSGLFWCNGSLVTNTKQDGKPYMLSAFHCVDGKNPNYNLFNFYFNFEAVGCTNPVTEPTIQAIQGCTLKANQAETDFMLLEMTPTIPSTFNPYFNGWNRDSTTIPTGKSVLLHHPNGDIKKITTDNQAPTVEDAFTNWDNVLITPPRTHLRSVFEEGTIEAGSSGAALFDANKRIIGYLHGGALNPTNPCLPEYGLSGWFAKAWNGGGTPQSRLKDWLDPLSTNPLTTNGMNTPQSTTATISGVVRFWNGMPMPNVSVTINGQTKMTDTNGAYSFTNVPRNQLVSVNVEKTDIHDNGVDGADLILMRRHLLDITPFDTPNKLFSGDVNKDNDVNGADLIIIRRLLLGITAEFPTTAWQFKTTATATNPAFPFGVTESFPLTGTFTGNVSNFDFYGYKTGDVNASALLGQ
jgi:lysyl endopeptidase